LGRILAVAIFRRLVGSVGIVIDAVNRIGVGFNGVRATLVTEICLADIRFIGVRLIDVEGRILEWPAIRLVAISWAQALAELAIIAADLRIRLHVGTYASHRFTGDTARH